MVILIGGLKNYCLLTIFLRYFRLIEFIPSINTFEWVILIFNEFDIYSFS